MAPANPRKRKSEQMEEPASPVAATTPTGSPRKKMRITQSQKQALMDNLQLESKPLHTFKSRHKALANTKQSLRELVNCGQSMLFNVQISEPASKDASIEFLCRFEI